MIELGRLEINTTEAFKEARRKTLNLAKALGYDEIHSTRLATIFSELTQIGRNSESGVNIVIGLDKQNTQNGLVINFKYDKTVIPSPLANCFFDDIGSDHHNGAFTMFWAFKLLPEPGLSPSKSFIENQRLMLAQPSKEVLLGDLQRKNEKLKTSSKELRKSKEIAEKATHALQEQITELSRAKRAMLNIMKDLEATKKEAELATNAKSDFLANMSHEIRTPMNAILGIIRLILKTDITPKQRDYINKMDISAKNLLGIINDILDFSKIEAGKLTMEIINFDLDEILSNLSNLVSIQAQKKGLELVFSVEKNIQTQLKGDPLRLSQILLNLTNNAIKFTQQGEIVVKIEAVDIQIDQVMLKFSVKDTGIGLSEKQKSNLFQSFQQADTSTTREYGGTGLGLAISKKLSEMMGGEINVESELGKGCNFYFTACFEPQTKETQKSRSTPEKLQSLKVLVVDDNATFREVLREYLEEFSFKVQTTSSGDLALDKLKQANEKENHPFDLVFMDWQMPGMDGIETSKKILEEPNLIKKPKIIMITGLGREDVMKQTKKLHLDGCLLKPVTYSMLFDTVIEAFSHKVDKNVHKDHDDTLTPEGFNSIRGSHILIVEDNEINQQVAKELLESEGFFVSVADNGKIAVEMVTKEAKARGQQETQFDAVLMDLQMPVMDGYTAAKKIRKWEKNNYTITKTQDGNEISNQEEKTKFIPIHCHDR